ncbi:hypothetical protein [Pseudoclavibacter sp. JSM 162008]|uniref:hypothetical protein n=1 Tax=Pseudoclavibacter sp. JSM 162008 TaxID=3229855 RepID=UPI0035258B59
MHDALAGWMRVGGSLRGCPGVSITQVGQRAADALHREAHRSEPHDDHDLRDELRRLAADDAECGHSEDRGRDGRSRGDRHRIPQLVQELDVRRALAALADLGPRGVADRVGDEVREERRAPGREDHDRTFARILARVHEPEERREDDDVAVHVGREAAGGARTRQIVLAAQDRGGHDDRR